MNRFLKSIGFDYHIFLGVVLHISHRHLFSPSLIPFITFADENQRQLADISFDKRIKVALARVLSSYSREEFFEYGVEKTEELKLMAADSIPETSSQESFIARRNGMTITRRHVQRRSSGEHKKRRFSNELQRSSRPYSRGDFASTSSSEISLEGLDATISSLLGGIGDYTIDDVKGLFEQVDTDSSGYIDKGELNSFLDLALSTDADKEVIDKVERGMARKITKRTLSTSSLISDAPRPPSRRSSLDSGASRRTSMASEAQEEVELIFGGHQAMDDLKELSLGPDSPVKHWSLFYCGGSNRIERELKVAKKKYGIGGFAVERFDW